MRHVRRVMLAAVLCLAGCEATASDAGRKANSKEPDFALQGGLDQLVTSNVIRNAVSRGPQSAADPTLDWLDPCMNNLQEVAGALMKYYAEHKHLPETLDLLPETSPGGEKISFTCKTTGRAYAYSAEGYPAPLEMRAAGWPDLTLLLYDAVPSHKMVQHLSDGSRRWDQEKVVRFGLVMEPPVRTVKGGMSAMQIHAVPIEDKLLEMYLRHQATPRPAAKPLF